VDAVLRAVAVYVFLLVVFRASGKRTLAQITSFDLVLLLIIGEATQQALLGEDFSVTNAAIVITTLLGVDIALSIVKEHWPRLATVTEGLPLVVVAEGEPLQREMRWARIDLDDVLEEARVSRGLERLDQVRFAILERDGSISIIPRETGQP
jgi:uncharacterized membrane protein YcaP (DUF421 family)